MKNFRKLSLRRKLTLIMMLTSSVALLLACAAFVSYDVVNFRRELVQRVSILAETFGDNCAAALEFRDAETARDMLAKLHSNKNIIAGCVYSLDGQVFAVYQRDGADVFVPPPLQTVGQKFTGGQLRLFRPVQHQGEVVGTILIVSDLEELPARLLRYAGIVTLVFLASLLVALVLSSQLQRLISDPILHLARVARSVAHEKNYGVRATKQSQDELGQLVDGFNAMLQQIQARDAALEAARDQLEARVQERTRELENTHLQLVEASRRGGMAEIATNVLHNVGNVLNSVNISATLVVDSVKKSKIASLARIAGLFQEHAADLGRFVTSDPQGKQLPAYLGQLSDHLLAEQNGMVAELDSLRGNIEHIKEIVAMQQNYAMVGGVKEIINVTNLVEDSLRITEGALNRHRVEIIREFQTVPALNLEKHKLLQLLVNLLRNAKHACQDSERVDRRMTVRVANGAGRIKISVSDNGVGIPPENLTRIFNYGFTTRKGGHGFGLHGGALAAKEMGGDLSVQSAGPGRGAMFTLELPCEPGISHP